MPHAAPMPKPAPIVNPWARPFWDGAREGRLLIQRCRACGKHVFYPRVACPHCFAEALDWGASGWPDFASVITPVTEPPASRRTSTSSVSPATTSPHEFPVQVEAVKETHPGAFTCPDWTGPGTRESTRKRPSAFVRALPPGTDPIGVRFRFYGMDQVNPTFTIVGVVGDVRHRSLIRAAAPEVFISAYQQPFRARYAMFVVVRPSDPAAQGTLAAAVRQEVRELDPDVPVELSTLDAFITASVAPPSWRRWRAMRMASSKR